MPHAYRAGLPAGLARAQHSGALLVQFELAAASVGVAELLQVHWRATPLPAQLLDAVHFLFWGTPLDQGCRLISSSVEASQGCKAARHEPAPPGLGSSPEQRVNSIEQLSRQHGVPVQLQELRYSYGGGKFKLNKQGSTVLGPCEACGQPSTVCMGHLLNPARLLCPECEVGDQQAGAR